MGNPILGGGKPPVVNNPINNMLSFVNSGGNLNVIANQMMANTPQFNQRLNQARNMVGNRSPKEFVLQMAKQQGVSEQQIMQLAGKMGLK